MKMNNQQADSYSSNSEIGAIQLQKLLKFVGTWVGKGQGEFPTIESFNYEDTIFFRHRIGTPYITFEQVTNLIDGGGLPSKPSHWESGILRPQDDGTIIMSSVHDSTRVEVLRGIVETSDSGLAISFMSTLHGNDPRMVSATREFILSGDEFSYTMSMATQRTPMLTGHLRASLKRQ